MDSIHKHSDEASIYKDRYERLLENHQNLQTLNGKLEERLLEVVTRSEKDKDEYTKHIDILSHQVYNLSTAISEIEKENERYKRDCSIAVNLLHCKPNGYMVPSLNSLPQTARHQNLDPSTLSVTNFDKNTHTNSSCNANRKHPRLFIPSTFLPTAAMYLPSEISNGDSSDNHEQLNNHTLSSAQPINSASLKGLNTDPPLKRNTFTSNGLMSFNY